MPQNTERTANHLLIMITFHCSHDFGWGHTGIFCDHSGYYEAMFKHSVRGRCGRPDACSQSRSHALSTKVMHVKPLLETSPLLSPAQAYVSKVFERKSALDPSFERPPVAAWRHQRRAGRPLHVRPQHRPAGAFGHLTHARHQPAHVVCVGARARDGEGGWQVCAQMGGQDV